MSLLHALILRIHAALLALLRRNPAGLLFARLGGVHHCPRCASPMIFVRRLPVAIGQGVTPAADAWRCTLCNTCG